MIIFNSPLHSKLLSSLIYIHYTEPPSSLLDNSPGERNHNILKYRYLNIYFQYNNDSLLVIHHYYCECSSIRNLIIIIFTFSVMRVIVSVLITTSCLFMIIIASNSVLFWTHLQFTIAGD